jgi:hypothetical protein
MRRPDALPSLAVALLAALVPAAAAQQAPAATPLVEYRIDATDDGRWMLRLHATGLDPAHRDVTLELADWGEWQALDAAYLHTIRFEPGLASTARSAGYSGDGARRFTQQLPADWNGELVAEYALTRLKFGADEHDAHPLLPFDQPSCTQAFLINTLMRVLVDGRPVPARRTVHIQAPPGATVATGWAGVSTGSQDSELPDGVDNSLIFLGELKGRATALAGDAPCEVIQLARGPDLSGPVLGLVQTLLGAYVRDTGRALGRPMRVFLADPCGGHTGGTHTDRGYVVHVHAEAADATEAQDFRRLLAHELFHEWLGGLVHAQDASTTWFTEGFTEYLASWQLAASGLLSRAWFAEQLAGKDAEVRDGEAYGQVAFADPGVSWRDGGGSHEHLAYSGGAVLAFHADVALRRAGRPGLPEMIQDLLARDGGRLTLQSIHDAFAALGLEDFYRRYVAGRELPPLGDALVSIGYVPQRTAAALTYLGIESSGGLAVGRVLSIDPDGPAAGTSLQVGDELLGFSPARENRPTVGDSVTTTFRFGLDRIASGAEEAVLDVQRAGQELQVRVVPRLISGGFRTAYQPEGESLADFFNYGGARK